MLDVQPVLAAPSNDQISGLDLALFLGFGVLALLAAVGAMVFFAWIDSDHALARTDRKARSATARSPWSRADIARAIGGLTRDQAGAADAIRRMMEAELAAAVKRIRSDSVKIGIASFIAGGCVTFAVTLLVHPLH
jgi:hypothetical protein